MISLPFAKVLKITTGGNGTCYWTASSTFSLDTFELKAVIDLILIFVQGGTPIDGEPIDAIGVNRNF